MKKLPMILAAACALAAAPAFAEMNDQSQSPSSHEFEGGSNKSSSHEYEGGSSKSLGRAHGEGGFRHHRWAGMEEGCKYITVRQRHGDELVTRHFKRCD